MPSFQIHPDTGQIDLPNGLTIPPSLTLDDFCHDPAYAQAQCRNQGTSAWSHHHLPGGPIDGHELLAVLCFYDQMLVNVDLTADLYPPGPKDWSRYSLDIEAAAKQFHDRLLEQMFGPPTHREHIFPGSLPRTQSALEIPLRWDFSWGQIFSSHDFNGGGTSIILRYADRTEQANRLHQERINPTGKP